MAQANIVAGESNSNLAGALVWDRQAVLAGQRSIPAFCEAHLSSLRAELLALAYDLGRVMVQGKEVQEHLQAGDSLSMWWCSLLFEKHPKVTPDLYPALKLRALELMLEEGDPQWDAVCLHGGDALLAGALRDFCQTTGRAFRHVPEAAAHNAQVGLRQRARRMYYALPGPCKAALRFFAWLWQCRKLVGARLQTRPAEACGTIATYFPNVDMEAAKAGRFRSRYWEDLHAALQPVAGPEAAGMDTGNSAPCADVNWLFIRFPSPQASLAECIALRDRFRSTRRDGRSFHYLEEFIDLKDMAGAVWRYLRLVLAGKKLESAARSHCYLGASRMNVWAYLGHYWEDSFGGWRCLERCLQQRALRKYVRWAGPQRWTIFPMENCPWERMLTEAVHGAEHGPVYGTQHSTVRPTDFRYFDDARTFATADCLRFQPDRIFGNGRGACAEMAAAGTPQERLGMVEALRYLYLSGRVDMQPQDMAPSPVPCTRLLVVTSFFADEVDAHMRVLAQWLREHKAHSAAAHWEVVVKPHPYLAVEPYLREYFMGLDMPPVLQEPIGGLLTPGTAVWASNSTTVALEAALMGLPVLVQRPENDVDLCPLQGVEGVARIVDALDVSAALAAPRKAQLPPDYLALNPALPLWRELLGLYKGKACQ